MKDKINKELKNGLILVSFGIVLFVTLSHFDIILNILKSIFTIFLPFIIGIVIAFILNVPITMIENQIQKKKKGILKNKKILRPFSIGISLLSLLIILFFVVALIIPDIGKTLNSFTNNLPTLIADTEKYLEDISINNPSLNEWLSKIDLNPNNIKTQVENWIAVAGKGILSSSFSFVLSFISMIANTLIGFIFAIYILSEKEKLLIQLKAVLSAFFPKKYIERFFSICVRSNKTFSKFISGQCLEACILGFLCFLGMTIFQFPYAISISVLVALTALIPVFGAFIAMVVGAILISVISVTNAFWFVVFFLILQQIEGNLIYPRVVGSSVGLPAIWVMMAVTIGGSCFGIWGMLISVPLSSVLYALIREYVNKKNTAKMIPKLKKS